MLDSELSIDAVKLKPNNPRLDKTKKNLIFAAQIKQSMINMIGINLCLISYNQSQATAVQGNHAPASSSYNFGVHPIRYSCILEY